MVEIRTPTLAPVARPAERVSTGQASGLYQAGASMQKVADQFSQYHEEKAADAADLIWAKAQADWGRRFNEGAKTATDGFTGATLQEYDAYVDEVLPTVPERQVENMQHMFAKYRIGLEAKALEVEATKRAEARAKARAEAQRLRELALLEEPSFANYQSISDGLKDENRRGLLGVYANAVLNGDDDMAVADFRGLLEDTDTFDQLLTADQKMNLMNGVDTYFAAKTNEDKAVIKTMITDAEAVALATGETDTSIIEAYIDSLPVSDEEKTLIREDLEKVHVAKDLHAISRQSFSVSQGILDEMLDTADDAASYQAASRYGTALAAHRKNMADDQTKAVMGSNRIVGKWYAASMDQDATPEERQQALTQFIGGIDADYDKQGVPAPRRTYMTNEHAKGVVDLFNEQMSSGQGLEVTNFLQSYEDRAPQVKAQLLENGLADSVVAAMDHADDIHLVDAITRAAAADIEELENQYNAVVGEDGDYKSNLDAFRGSEKVQGLREVWLMGRPGGDKAWSDRMETVFRTHAWQRGNVDPNASSEDMLKRFFPNEVVQSVGGSGASYAAVLPEGFSERDFTDGLDELVQPSVFTGFLKERLSEEELLRWIGSDDPRDLELASLVAGEVLGGGGVWVTNDDGTGVVLGGINEFGQWVPYSYGEGDGDLLEVTFDEIGGFAETSRAGEPLGDDPTSAWHIHGVEIGEETKGDAGQTSMSIDEKTKAVIEADEPTVQQQIDAIDSHIEKFKAGPHSLPPEYIEVLLDTAGYSISTTGGGALGDALSGQNTGVIIKLLESFKGRLSQ